MRGGAAGRTAWFLGLFVLALWLGRESRPDGSQVALVWPAAGVGVWWLLRGRSRRETGVAVALVAAATVLVNGATGAAWFLAAGFGLLNVLHAGTGAALVRRLLPEGDLSEPAHVVRLLLLSVATGLLSGSASAALVVTAGVEPLWPTWGLFVARNAGTTFFVLAAVLSLRSRPADSNPVPAPARPAEVVVVTATGLSLFCWLFLTAGSMSVLFVALAVPVWAGVRLGVRVSAALGTACGLVAVVGTVAGTGAFETVADPASQAALVQCFTVLVLVTSQSLATMQESRDALAAQLARSLDRLRETSDAAVIGKAVVERGPDGGWTLTEPNPALVELLGRDPSTLRWRQLLDPDDARTTRLALDAIARGERTRWQGEVRHLRPDGTVLWTDVHVSHMSAPDGRTTVVAQVVDVTQRRAAEERLRFLADHDELTRLPNRARLLQELARLLADRRSRGVAALFVDLDRFKQVNDTLGHEAGDLVLRLVADVLRETVRPEDLVARLGGDEFVVVCPGVADLPTALGVAQRVGTRLDAALSGAAAGLGLGASVGTVLATRDDDAASLLRRCDSAMYESKHARRRPPHVPSPR